MPVRSIDAPSRAAPRHAAMLLIVLSLMSPPAAAQSVAGSFREGTCSGVLCDYIGGAQAPSARQQTSLFREGECGGVLCEAIGGSQAPKHAEPPPPCGGGLLCDMMPYKMGVPVTAAEAARRQEAERQQAAPAPAPVAEPSRRHRRKVARTATDEGRRMEVAKRPGRSAE